MGERALTICNHLFKGKETIAVSKSFRTWDNICTTMKNTEITEWREKKEKKERMAHALKIVNHLFHGKENRAIYKSFRTWDHVHTQMTIAEEKKQEAMARALT